MSSRRVNSVIVFGDFSSRSIRLYRESIFSNNSQRLFLADIKWHSMLQIFVYIAAPATTGAALTFRKGEDAD